MSHYAITCDVIRYNLMSCHVILRPLFVVQIDLLHFPHHLRRLLLQLLLFTSAAISTATSTSFYFFSHCLLLLLPLFLSFFYHTFPSNSSSFILHFSLSIHYSKDLSPLPPFILISYLIPCLLLSLISPLSIFCSPTLFAMSLPFSDLFLLLSDHLVPFFTFYYHKDGLSCCLSSYRTS